MGKKRDVITRINEAIGQNRGIALPHAELCALAAIINTNVAAAKAHEDMLHALIQRSPAHQSFALH